jgi:hypothetical protein
MKIDVIRTIQFSPNLRWNFGDTIVVRNVVKLTRVIQTDCFGSYKDKRNYLKDEKGIRTRELLRSSYNTTEILLKPSTQLKKVEILAMKNSHILFLFILNK